jgi:trk system potassium uptake protein TrkH
MPADRGFVERAMAGIHNPAQIVVGAFAALILVGAALLRLPVAVDAGVEHPGTIDSLFWATSAVTVTGLGSTDVSVFSLFGELVLLALMQLGGFGIMTIGSVLALVASRRVGLRQRMLAQAEIGAVDMGELRSLLAGIAKITLAVEAATALVLFVRFALRDDSAGVARAAYSAVFHAIAAFNNAGISLNSDNLVPYASDPFVAIPVSFAFIVGGLGFPIIIQLRRRLRPRQWSLHAKITLFVTAVLLAFGPLVVLVFEWSNSATLGPMNVFEKLHAAWFQGVTPRTAGFNTVPIGDLREPTLNIMSSLMFIGGGSASTAGGIKVTTFAVLGFAIWSEVRGDHDVNMFGRRLPPHALRQALTIALLSVGVVFGTAIVLNSVSGFSFTATLFEAASAFGTVGLSTGITTQLSSFEHLLLIVVMLAGRVGPVTFVAALTMRESSRSFRFAEERPIIG